MSATLAYCVASPSGNDDNVCGGLQITLDGRGGHELLECAVASGEGALNAFDSFTVTTGEFSGRSTQDKYIVVELRPQPCFGEPLPFL